MSLPIGLWWFYRMRQDEKLSVLSNVGYLLLAMFGTHNSLVCMMGTRNELSIQHVIVNVIDDFLMLLFMPVIYYIIADITKSNVGRRKVCMLFLPALLAGILNTVLHNVYFFNIVLFLQLLLLGYAMLKDFYVYRKRVFCYYVDIETTDFEKAHDIVRCFFFATIIFYMQLLFQHSSIDGNSVTLLLYNISIAVIVYVVGWNMSSMNGDTIVIDVVSKPYTPAEIQKIIQNADAGFVEKEIADSQLSSSDIPSSRAIEDIVERWAQRPDKPYLKEGISLTMAADDMNLSVRVVSFYLNNVLKVNFNAWINTLRIKEAVRLLDKGSSMPVSVIAVRCGFADTSMLSKNFKKIVGKTITEYRKENGLA